jgi:hypothetical protein
MLFLANNHRPVLVAAATVVGIGSYVFPLIIPWHLLLPVVGAVAVISSSETLRSFFVLVCLIVVGAVLAGFLPSTLASSMLAATALALLGTPIMAAVVLLLQTSIISTTAQLASDMLRVAELEVVAPALLSIAFLVSVNVRNALIGAAAAALTIILALIAIRFAAPPHIQIAIVAIPACALALKATPTNPNPISTTIPIILILALLCVSWWNTPPRLWKEAYYLLPFSDEAPEAKLFTHYDKALAFAGIAATRVTNPEEISENSLVLLPWLTAPLNDLDDQQFATRLGDLARKRKWIVVLGGEHNDLGGSAARVEQITGSRLFRNDLTVPIGNTDDSGPLHVLDLRAWLHETIFNRGASVQIGSLWDKVLLAGDGWWAERDIGEWLWVGDYVWQTGDRAGRLLLASSLDRAGARWVALGDNSFLINTQIYADPRPLIRVIESATLWPSFLKDLVLALFAAILCFARYFTHSAIRQWTAYLICLSAVVAATAAALSSKPEKWQDTYLRQSGFDSRNFNIAFSEHPELFENRRLLRVKTSITGAFKLPEGDVIVFGIVGGAADIGNAKLSNCRRVGGLTSGEGPFLMDAQACRVEGQAKVLIGTTEGAAAIVTANGSNRALVILDNAFLAQRAPTANIEWLTRELKSWQPIRE